MNSSRRSLLQVFGIGSIIAPIIGGAVDHASAAQLIELPKVRPVELFKEIPSPFDLSRVKRAAIRLEMEDGSIRDIGLPSPKFLPIPHRDLEITTYGVFGERSYIPGLCDMVPPIFDGSNLELSVHFTEQKQDRGILYGDAALR